LRIGRGVALVSSGRASARSTTMGVRAEVAELADATVSNTVGGNLVRVQIPASAPRNP
jgi:hypothetical protein